MGRDVTAGVASELTSAKIRPVIFFQGEFGDGFLRLWSGVGTKSWNSLSWTGAGNLLGMSDLQETADVVANSTTLQLSGMPASLVSKVHTYAEHGLEGKVWIGFLDASEVVIADPYLAFSGRLDVPDVVDQGDECVISITYESRLVDLLRARIWRYTHESQQSIDRGDRGFEYVAALQDQVLEW